MPEPNSPDVESKIQVMSENRLLTKLGKILHRPIKLLNENSDVEIPSKKEDLYLIDTSEARELNHENYPSEHKGKMIDRLFTFLKQKNRLPKPGYGTEYPSNWQYADIDSEEVMYGKKVGGGKNGETYYDSNTNELTHLWKRHPTEKQAAQNIHQMELYKKLNDKHPFFKFVREVPGGWTTEYFPNQGNLKEYLDNGGKLTKDHVERAINNLREMQNLANEAHGDIVKRPDFIDYFNQGLMQKDLDDVKSYGYLNYQNILVDPNGELVIVDYAGASDPSATGGWNNPERHDPKSSLFKYNELKFFSEGLQSLLQTTNQNSTIQSEQLVNV